MKVSIAAAAALAILSLPAKAEEQMSVEPGQWLTRTVLTTTIMPGPQTHEDSSCITPEEATFDPQTMMDENSDCSFDSIEQTSTDMSFSMTCTMEGGITMNGEGQFETDDSRRAMSGSMVMTGSVPGIDLPLEMTMEMTSERTGDCDS